MSKISRRSLLRSASASAAALVVAEVAAAVPPGEVDPIFVLIEEHRLAHARHAQACDADPETPAEQDASGDAWWDASWALVDPGPVTIAGVAALLIYTQDYAKAGHEWPERDLMEGEAGPSAGVFFESEVIATAARVLADIVAAGEVVS
jgi:hypothetical protein